MWDGSKLMPKWSLGNGGEHRAQGLRGDGERGVVGAGPALNRDSDAAPLGLGDNGRKGVFPCLEGDAAALRGVLREEDTERLVRARIGDRTDIRDALVRAGPAHGFVRRKQFLCAAEIDRADHKTRVTDRLRARGVRSSEVDGIKAVVFAPCREVGSGPVYCTHRVYEVQS
jgi:hypothetical protein